MSHLSPTTAHEVLVVGAGPAGLTTAITLARYGIDVLVIEKHAGTSPFPKATGVSTRTMELLRAWGLEDRVRAGAMAVQPLFSMSHTLTGPAQMTVPFGYPTDEQALAVSPVTPGCVPQDHLEPVLRDHLIEQGGTIRFGTELTSLSTGPDGVEADVREPATGRRYRVRSTYVIGADGPRSFVRTSLRIGVDDLGSIGEFVSFTFRADLARKMPRVPSAINAVGVFGAEGLFVPTSADDRWVFAREWHPEIGETIEDWTPNRVVDVLRTGSGVPDLDPFVLGVTEFSMGGHVATGFRVGPAFLVGDAAHRTTPVGGTGMNTAIQGAHNLGWKLAWVLRGWAGENLLDSYELERRPIGIANVRRSLQRGPQPPADGLSWDVGVRYDSPVLADGTGTGERAPHVWVRYRDAPVSTLDVFDGRLTVLTGPDGRLWREAAADLADTMPLAVLVAGEDLIDDAGVKGVTLAERYGLGAHDAVLIRPDGYLAWRHRVTSNVPPREALRYAVDVALGHSPDHTAMRQAA